MAGNPTKHGDPARKPQRLHRVEGQRKQFRKRWASARTSRARLLAVTQSLVALTTDNQPDHEQVDALVEEYARAMEKKLREIYARRHKQAKTLNKQAKPRR